MRPECPRLASEAPVLAALRDPQARPGLGGVAYDTAWLAALPSPQDPCEPRFRASFDWLVEHQLPDGSWGGSLAYEHDRILCTLAALAAVAAFSRTAKHRAALAAGTRYLWQHGHKLAAEPIELVGFELLLPALVARAKKAGIAVPPHLDVYGQRRAEKLRLIPTAALYSPQVTIVHSLEFLGDDADPQQLSGAIGPNGSVGHSPAATAFSFDKTGDRRALGYLEELVAASPDGAVTVAHPCETFELLWTAYHLHLAGVPAAELIDTAAQEELDAALMNGGVGFSNSFLIPDSDDTAVALLLLRELGWDVDAGLLESFALNNGCFVSYHHERHASPSANLHVLHALLRVPGYPARRETAERLLDYLTEAREGHPYWLDKWHISPYYTTAHALRIFAELPARYAARVELTVRQTREWLRQTQNADGSWGFYGPPTLEETAYGLLALAGEPRVSPADRQRCAMAARYLQSAGGMAKEAFPPMWVEKCLYAPSLIVQAAIAAALLTASALSEGPPVAHRGLPQTSSFAA